MIQRVKTGVIADGAVTLAKLNDETENSFNFRNRVHNGDFRINQRETWSRSNTVNNITDSNAGGRAMAADRWWTYALAQATNGLNSSNCTIAIVNDHPVVTTGNCYSITVNTNATANANVVVSNLTTDFALLRQSFEGVNIFDLFNTLSTTPMVLSFWVKSNKTGTYSVQLRPNSDGSGRTILLPYTINSSGTWERKTLSIPVFNFGSVPTDTANRMHMMFGLASNLKANHTDGSSTITQAQIDACTNQWGPNPWGDGVVVNNHVNLFENTGNYFRITDVQLEPGSAATTFERRPFPTELALCQRYYEHSYPPGSPVGTASSAGAFEANNSSYNNNIAYGPPVFFKVLKRGTPSITGYNYVGTSGSWHYARSGIGETTLTFGTSIITEAMFTSRVNVGAAWVPCYVIGHWTASAEI